MTVYERIAVRQEGAHACFKHHAEGEVLSNPYEEGTEKYLCWEDGYLDFSIEGCAND